MRVVGRSGQVMDLPEQRAKALLREGVVERADKPAKKQADKPPDKSEGAEVEAERPKPQRTRKPKSEE